MPAMATIEPPARLEQRPRRAAEPHLGEEFQVEARIPIGVGEREEIAAPVGAGVVDQDVEPAEALFREARKPRRLALAAQIGGVDFGPAAQRANARPQASERALFPRRSAGRPAGRGKLQRDALADAAARAGHQRDLALQFGVHRSIDCGTTAISQPASERRERTRRRPPPARKRHGLPLMLRPIGAGLAPHLDHLGLVLIRRRIGAAEVRRPADAALASSAAWMRGRSVLEARLSHDAAC